MGYFGIPFRNGVPIGLGSIAGFGAPQEFSPSELFPSGTAGAWYDPSDLTTLFTTSAGTTPVAMPGQGSAVSVGLMLDKSQGLVLGSELANAATQTLATATGTQSGAGWNITATGSFAILLQPSIIAAGKWYKYTVSWSGNTNGRTIRFVAGGSGGSNSSFSFGTSASGTGTVIVSGGTQNTSAYFQINDSVNGDTFYLEITSVRELPGNHAIAFNDTTARPELRARVNLLVATATLSTQNVTTQATSYTLSFAGAGSITLSGTATGSYSAGTHTITCTAGTLTLTVSGTVTTADLRPANSGALLPAYQAVVDANTYDTSGFPLYLRFDGIDDSMYTPANLNLSGTDKVAVFAGVRKLTTPTQIISEFSATVDTTPGSFNAAVVSGGAFTGAYYASLRGNSGVASAATNTPAAPSTNVITGLCDIALSSDEVVLRINGAQAATSGASSAGTGNFGTYPLYIGSRNNSSLWLNGNIYSLIIAGSAVSAGNISATEQWVANKTGIVIP